MAVKVLALFTSDTGREYQVRQGRDSVIYCTCPAWAFSRMYPKDCKHLARIRTFMDSRSDRLAYQSMNIRNVEDLPAPQKAAIAAVPEPKVAAHAEDVLTWVSDFI